MKKSTISRFLSTATIALALSLSQAMAVEPEVYVYHLLNPLPPAIDGDTFHLPGVGVIRLQGGDAMESKQRCTKPDGIIYDGAEEARKMLDSLLSEGTLTCIKTGKSYHRIVAYCEVDGRDIVASLISKGVMFLDRRHASGLYETILSTKQEIAYEAEDGAFGCTNLEMPWDYRERINAEKKRR